MKTPDDFRREDVKKMFASRLGEGLIRLEPASIKIEESSTSDRTVVDFSFDLIEFEQRSQFSFERVEASGFVDAIFTSCYNTFVDKYVSLQNLKLIDLTVRPIFSMSHSPAGSDAKTDVIFRLEVKKHGVSEFTSRSSSIVHSSFAAMLEAFQFYMNCEKAFKKLQTVLKDAEDRRRGDIMQSCLSDLSLLTSVNMYDCVKRGT